MSMNFNAGRFRRHVIPFLVWILALCIVGMIFVKRQVRLELSGLVSDFKTEIAAFDTGVINKVMVTRYEPVKKGQVLAVLDDTILRSELALVKAELDLLKAKLAIKKQSEKRKFLTDVEEARLEILELRAELEPDRVVLLDREYDVKRYTELNKRRALAADTLKKAQFDLNSLKKKIEINEKRLAQAEESLKAKMKRANTFLSGGTGDAAIDYIRKSLNVETMKLKDIEVRLQSLVLRSPIDGVVTRIKSRVGDVVRSGEAIFAVVTAKPSEILAYVSELQVSKLKAGDELGLQRLSRKKSDLILKVNHIGPAVEVLPERLWLHPDFPQYGVPVTILLPEKTDLIPGEVIKIFKK